MLYFCREAKDTSSSEPKPCQLHKPGLQSLSISRRVAVVAIQTPENLRNLKPRKVNCGLQVAIPCSNGPVCLALKDLTLHEANKMTEIPGRPSLLWQTHIAVARQWLNCYLAFSFPRTVESISPCYHKIWQPSRITVHERSSTSLRSWYQPIKGDCFRDRAWYQLLCPLRSVAALFHLPFDRVPCSRGLSPSLDVRVPITCPRSQANNPVQEWLGTIRCTCNPSPSRDKNA